MLLRVAQHAEVDADGARNEVAVRVAARATIDGARVHARTTADALQRLPVLGVGNPLRSAVVDQHDVHVVGRRTGLAEVARKRRRGLTRTCSAEHALEDGQTLVVGNDFLQADGGDVQARTRRRHVGIALVGAYYDVARLGNAEVGTRHTCVGGQKLVAQRETCTIGKVCGVVVALLLRDAFLFEQLAHVVVAQMDGGHHDVRGCLTLQLDDALAQVGFDHLNAFLLEVGVHAALLSEHRLRLHHLLHVVVLQNTVDDFVELLGILRPVYLDTVLFGIGGKLVEIFVEMGDGVALDG